MSKRVKMEPEDLARSAYTIGRIDAVLASFGQQATNPHPVLLTEEGWATIRTALNRYRGSIIAGTTPRMFLTKQVLPISETITDEQ